MIQLRYYLSRYSEKKHYVFSFKNGDLRRTLASSSTPTAVCLLFNLKDK